MLRRILKTISLALVAIAPLSASMGNAGGVAEVVAVHPTGVADLILLRGGFDAGLRQGMVCRVSRGNAEVAEILLVELRPNCSAALIMSVAPQQSIRAGDLARIKILKS